MSQGNQKDSSRLRGDDRARREQRQREAIERNEVTAKLTPESRLARIEGRPGQSKRERLRLLAAIEQRGKTKK